MFEYGNVALSTASAALQLALRDYATDFGRIKNPDTLRGRIRHATRVRMVGNGCGVNFDYTDALLDSARRAVLKSLGLEIGEPLRRALRQAHEAFKASAFDVAQSYLDVAEALLPEGDRPRWLHETAVKCAAAGLSSYGAGTIKSLQNYFGEEY